jgi:ABC-type molybdate transport system substrate-binding protein
MRRIAVVWHFRAEDTMRAFGLAAAIAAVLVSVAGMAAAAEVRVLGVDAVEQAVRGLAADFAKETGHRVVFTIASPAVVMRKIAANETHDAVIVSEPAMDQLDTDGIINPESRVRLAKDEATTYEGGLLTDGSVPEAARAFIRFLAEPDARAKWLAAKLEPLADH